MKTIKIPALFVALLLGVSFSACDKTPATPDQETTIEEEINLDMEYGGLDTSDEAPGFGDPAMINDFSEDQDVNEPVSTDAETVADMDNETIPAYFVRVTWGQLEGDSTISEKTDFSGFAELNKGTLAVLKTIRFEDSDHLNLPRESRQRVDFTSIVSVHYDGILLAVIDNDDSTDAEGTLTLSMGSWSRTFTFAELDSAEYIEEVDALGNEVSIVSRSREVRPFAGGFLSGHWITDGNGRGKFKGRWINSMGTNAGHLKGAFGTNKRGVKVAFGKYINIDGSFGGLLAGEWGYRGAGRNHGWFNGRWVDQDRVTRGSFKTVWKTGRPGSGRGFFHGRWMKKETSTDE